MADAIVRTLSRLLVARRHLLEWVTAAQAELGAAARAARVLPAAWPAASRSPRRRRASRSSLRSPGVAVAAPFLAALAAGARDRALGESAAADCGRRGASRAEETRWRCACVARRTWRFFETFVDGRGPHAAAGQLPGRPEPVVAHRTSPTNIGLYLLSTVAARDFGWIGTLETVERLEATLADDDAAGALPRPLLQLVRHARSAAARADVRLVGRQRQSRGTSDRARERVPRDDRAAACARSAWVAGSRDALALTRESLRTLTADRHTQTVTRNQLDDALDAIAAALASRARCARRRRGATRAAGCARRNRARHRSHADRRAQRGRGRRGAALDGGAAR